MPSAAAKTYRFCLVILAGALLLLPGWGLRGNAVPAGGPPADALWGERYTAGRLSTVRAWQPCTVSDSAGIVVRWRCGPATAQGPASPGGQSRTRVAGPDADTAALRARALADLQWPDGAPPTVDRAIRSFEQANRLAPGSSAILNDLAVAYMTKAERDQQLSPMLHALNSVERAIALDSLLLPALFNRALIMERLYLLESARRAWSRYRAVERDTRWLAEAGGHERRIEGMLDTLSWTSFELQTAARYDSSTRAALRDRVRRSPQAAREAGFTLLREWGVALAAGERGRAARLLALAREIGDASERLELDRSVPLAVRAIDGAAAEAGALRALANGHVLLDDGIRLHALGKYEEALPTLAEAERTLEGRSPAVRWALFYRGAAEVNRARYANADRLFHRVLAQSGPGEPALLGKTLLALGLSQLRRGNHDLAIQFYRKGQPHVDAAGEAENQGSAALLLSEGLGIAGQLPEARTHAYRALGLLAPYRHSNFLNNHLAIVATYARGEGLGHAALAITDEMVGVARSTGKPNVVALALCTRARDLLAVGRTGAADADVAEAVRWADRIEDGRSGNRLRAHIALARGQLARARDSRGALPLLAAAVELYRSVSATDLYLPTALYEAAMAAQAVGDTAKTRLWLHQAVRHIDQQRASFTSVEVLATFSESVENVFDALIEIELAAGRAALALDHLERSRVAPWRGARATDTPQQALPAVDRLAASLPHDMLFAEYALLQNQLVVWTASQGGWRVHAVPVSRDSVSALVQAFEREAGSANPAAANARARLYDLLIQPFASELDGVRRLTVVPDRELGRLPFAALWDAKAKRYVVHSFQLRTLPSAAFFFAALRQRSEVGPESSALVIGNPALGPVLSRTLEPLPHAEHEGAAVADLYHRPRLLTGTLATRDSVLAHLSGSSIFHFAGHAVFNAEQPEQSFLALAPVAGRDAGTLQAREIGRLRPTNLAVVVLSACSSLNPRPSHTGAVAGLAHSFLRAGAPATISTVWDVDDATTTPLLVEFHRRLAAGTPPPEALRLAQLSALRSGRAELEAPAAWAAFIYTGP